MNTSSVFTLAFQTPPPQTQVQIGAGELARLPEWLAPEGPDPHLLLIGDQCLRARGEALAAELRQRGWRTDVYWVEVSEAFKDLTQLQPIYSWMLKVGAHRRSWLLALGGGVIGDAAGFVAATYMRGLRWLSVPTTLLAQVDSGLGGKTGVNHPSGKNLIGAFHQPRHLIADPELLLTLSARDRLSGYGEMLKYGLIFDPDFYQQLIEKRDRLLALDPEVLTSAIARCLALKAEAVAPDEYDQQGVREILNFGHTFGHALEKLTDYSGFRHGEAVILGMWAALELSALAGLMPGAASIQAELAALPLPVIPAAVTAADLLAALRHDKKSEGAQVRLILLSAPGCPQIIRDLPPPLLAQAAQALLDRFGAS